MQPPTSTSEPPSGEEGTISAFVAVLAVALIAVAGLAYDGGQIIAATAQARDLAGAAARAGAQQLAPGQVHAGRAWLDPAAAEHAATDFLAATGISGSVRATETDIVVTVTLIQPMRLLPLPDRAITVTAVSSTTSDVLEADS
jgi:Flp pilus assembly protein TadG